ncbi:hypothetical protein [Polaribacter porphyrae]|uniref:Transcriptional regulator n=1 Tax=Polaribacter porphyrae TaxID=1137780 RepID=A0A2S7WL46_9FLAO|nr:hypothetical protein [Polaribacter porphyrae]PQJ78330.1 hypothetical protein BTO18_03605 [Polaribacter porphyrae]
MKQSDLSAVEQSVLNAVKEEHLPSYEILKKVDNISMILSLYNILDKLATKGVLKSYIKQNIRYHYAA